jgi:hypothetical protein
MVELVDEEKEEFKAYVRVQKSGVTNMFAVNVVCDLSGLKREQCLDIMKNYQEYSNKFGVNMKNISE